MFYKIFTLVTLFIILGCKPIDITDPIPTMKRVIMEASTKEFTNGIIEFKIPFNDNIAIHEAFFSLERQDINLKESYIISIGTFIDTLEVDPNLVTEVIYEREGSLPSCIIFSEHPIKVYVRLEIFSFGD